MPRAPKASSSRTHSKAVSTKPEDAFDAYESALAQETSETNEISPFNSIKGKSKAEKKMRQAVESKVPEIRRQHLDALHPYSRSHLRRMKRKTADQLAGGGLSALLNELDDSEDDEVDVAQEKARAEAKLKRELKAAEKGKIGEGRGKPLGQKARVKEVQSNQKHVVAIRQNPAFKANPFAAIRLHASNSLIMKDAPAKK